MRPSCGAVSSHTHTNNKTPSHLYCPYRNCPSELPLPLKSNRKLDSPQLQPSVVDSLTSSSLFLLDMYPCANSTTGRVWLLLLLPF